MCDAFFSFLLTSFSGSGHTGPLALDVHVIFLFLFEDEESAWWKNLQVKSGSLLVMLNLSLATFAYKYTSPLTYYKSNSALKPNHTVFWTTFTTLL